MQKKRKGPITAAELVAQMNADPEFVARKAKADAERAEHARRLREEERPLLEELAASGYRLNSVWDLVNTRSSYASAIPILLKHIQQDYSPPILEGIARALGTPEARCGWTLLVRLYETAVDRRFRQGLAVALAGASDDSVLTEVIRLAGDERMGDSRLILVFGIAKSSDPRADAALHELRKDPYLAYEVRKILRKRR